jgi:hypothetical protein
MDGGLVGLRAAPPSVVTRTSRLPWPLRVEPRGGARAGMCGFHVSNAPVNLAEVLAEAGEMWAEHEVRPAESDLPAAPNCTNDKSYLPG